MQILNSDEKLKEKIKILLDRSEKNSYNISIIRLVVFVSGIISTLVTFFLVGENYTYLPLIFFTIVFLIITHYHSKVIQKIKLIKIYQIIKKDICARKFIDWENIKNYYSPDNKSELDRDLNISGNRSLLHLLNVSTNKKVGEILYNKIVNPTDLDKTKASQKIIEEISKRSDIINKTLLYGYSYKSDNYEEFEEWLNTSSNSKKLPQILLVSTYIINLGLILLSLSGITENYFYYSSVIYIFSYYFYLIKTLGETKKSLIIIDEIKSFSGLFNYLNSIKVSKTSILYEKLMVFSDGKNTLKLIFRSLKNINSILELRANPVVWFPIVFIFPLDLILINKLNKHREKLKKTYPESVNAYWELAAYISFAVFKKNNPEYCTPNISENSDTLIEGIKIGHPLIQKAEKVENDYILKTNNGIDIITGSNMSGKSTFLRTLGLNLLLAYSGSVVNAKKFQCSHMHIFTCINVSDSVVDGISYFYSEVKRLNKLLTLIEQSDKKTFILIDEIFKGTNNKERLEGSKLYVRNIVGGDVFGLISTHDLELGTIEKEYETIRNFHFKDSIKDDLMYFDYKIHEGICPTTNALKIIKQTMNI